ncbi:HNH endonuclease, partial [Nocardiopsis sp. HNM0947]|nr:HNH endonuclease [Nocardiopsis coralli]
AAEFAERGARLYSNFAGFTFEAWGPVSDGERLKAALASFTAPYGTTEKNPDTGAGADGTAASGGTGNAGGSGLDFIPPGEAVTSRYGRTYDALISAMGFAHGHHGHTHIKTKAGAEGTGKGNASGTAGGDAGADPVGDTDGDGPGGSASGGADGPADDGSASGGGCSQPPGTKAVINITVPLSALMGFGFAFKNDTNANGNAGADGAADATGATGPEAAGAAGASGATGSPPGSCPGSGAESGPDP